MMRWIRSSFIFLLLLALTTSCVKVSLFGPKRGPLEEERIEGAGGKLFTLDKILIIDLSGVVASFGHKSMLVKLKDRLQEAEKDDFVKGVVLRINSPGGGVTASDVIYHELLAFKKRMKAERGAFPVIALMEDIAASGGAYIAMAADEIYALPTTTTGSIGVIATWPKWQGLTDKIGLEMNVIKSADKKDIGSPWRDLTKEEQAIFQDMIDHLYERFLDVVVRSREHKGLTRETLKTFADGRVFVSKVALDHKLIDGIEYLDEVIERTRRLAGTPDAKVISYEYEGAYRGNIYAESVIPTPAINIGNIELIDLKALDAGAAAHTRFLYLWSPGL